MSSSLSSVALMDLCDLDDALLDATLIGFPRFGTAPVRRAFADAVSDGVVRAWFPISVPRVSAHLASAGASADEAFSAAGATLALPAGATVSGAANAGAPAPAVKVAVVAAAARSMVC